MSKGKIVECLPFQMRDIEMSRLPVLPAYIVKSNAISVRVAAHLKESNAA